MINKYNNILKTNIVAGIIVVFPILTILTVINILVKWLRNCSLYLMNIFWINPNIRIVSPHFRLLAYILPTIFIFIIGIIVKTNVGNKIVTSIEYIIRKIPILGTLHIASRQFIKFVCCKDKSNQFKKVVFIPYPNNKVYSVAFVTGEQYIHGERYLSIFMPTTPNPTTGFLLFFKETDIIYTYYTVEEAFKIIISIGIITMNK
ncbi:MAG: DUF502 domain-containing protein [Endomicrobium sp.]|jgi:uncharacterized membrane protein|nr:DUF502 domain-containing protein [Endomicrobium sp.]